MILSIAVVIGHLAVDERARGPEVPTEIEVPGVDEHCSHAVDIDHQRSVQERANDLPVEPTREPIAQLGIDDPLVGGRLGHPLAGGGSKRLLGFKDLLLVGFFLSIGLSGIPTLQSVAVGGLFTLGVTFKVVLFFILLIITAYSVTFKGNNPIESQKQKLISVVKNHQDKGISTLVITALPIWAAVQDRLTNEEN